MVLDGYYYMGNEDDPRRVSPWGLILFFLGGLALIGYAVSKQRIVQPYHETDFERTSAKISSRISKQHIYNETAKLKAQELLKQLKQDKPKQIYFYNLKENDPNNSSGLEHKINPYQKYLKQNF